MTTEFMAMIDKVLEDDPLLKQRVHEALTDMRKAINLTIAGCLMQGWIMGRVDRGMLWVNIHSQPLKVEVKESTQEGSDG